MGSGQNRGRATTACSSPAGTSGTEDREHFGDGARSHKGESDVPHAGFHVGFEFEDRRDRDDVLPGNGRGGQLDFKDVIGIDREAVVERKAAGGIERQFVADAFVTAGGPGGRFDRKEVIDGGLEVRVADREARDGAANRHVTFDQDRGHRKDIADIVKTIAGVVDREGVTRFDVEREQVADGVRVFVAIQAVDGGMAGVRMGGGGSVELGFEVGGEGFLRGGIGVRDAERRHLLRFDFPEHLFPEAGIARNVGEVEALERQAGGFEFVVVAALAILLRECLSGLGPRVRGRRLECERQGREREGCGGEAQQRLAGESFRVPNS